METNTFSNLINFIREKKIKIDLSLLRKAYGFLSKNKTAEELNFYISRAFILVEFYSDTETIIASLIDPNLSLDIIKNEFGEIYQNIFIGFENIENILRRVDKADKQDFDALRKYILTSCNNLRVIIIKSAEKLYFLRNIDNYNYTEEYKFEYAREVLEIYSPMCEYIGLNSLKSSMDDISFRILNFKEYSIIEDTLKKYNKINLEYIKKIETDIHKELSLNYIKSKIFSRQKNIYSIYKKIIKIKGYFDEDCIYLLNDLWALTILVNNIEQCYKSLGIIHTMYPYKSSEFDDYIARPKSTGYRALQTTVEIDMDRVIEIQIKTHDMHEYNEFGPASHVAYKLGLKGKKNNFFWIKDVSFAKHKNINEIKLFEDKIFVFTPKGMVKELEKGANPVDFAYSIHTQIGNSMRGAKVNGKLVSLDHKLSSGDTVDILKEKGINIPKKDWENIASQISTKRVIRKFIKENKLSEDNKISAESIHKKKEVLKIDTDNILENNFNFDNIAVKIAKCCNPTLKDEIIGKVSLEGVIKIHKKSCKNIDNLKQGVFDFSWET